MAPSTVADASTRRALELTAIVELLAELTSFGPARDLALETEPSPDPVLVAVLHDQTDEAARLALEQPQASIGGARDIRASLERARRGGRLQASELLDVAETLRATGLLVARLRSWRGPHLAELRDQLDDAPELQAEIGRSLDESGTVLDSASTTLAAIRRRLRVAQGRVRERLNAMLRSSELAGAIGEAIITMRGGRYVIPVRADARGRVKGIVHDQSASGATVFVEPLSVVELNNTWTEASIDEQREEERILDELSAGVEARAESLIVSLTALARADLWLARARLADRMDAIRPAASSDAVELLSARHPLLGSGAVPIDLRLGERFGYRALVVTGPNTGGKTVSLKTLGLLALMNQCGLRIPAAGGSRLPTFSRIMADIGDEQSIAQSLSTFSSHLHNVIRFVEAAGPDTLILLDEIGAGTDPTEGSVLAMAILNRLLEAGATVAATTHYAELKTFAGTHPLVSNAAVEFDVATLRPTYRLSIGLPGKSQAFAIAERLGLPGPILDDARRRLSSEQVSFEETLAAIQRTERERNEELEAAHRQMAAAGEEWQRARSGVSRARQEAAEILSDAQRAAEDLLRRTEREVADARRALARERRPIERAGADLQSVARRVSSARSSVVADAQNRPAADIAESAEPRIGLWARSRTLGTAGRIVEISGRTGRVTLETDGPRVVVPADDVEVMAEPAAGPSPPDREAEELRRRAAERVEAALDLRGERVEAALERLERYLDEALLAGLESAVIVHGSGTGALRRAIRERLAEHPRVRQVRSGRRDEGGDGATVAEF